MQQKHRVSREQAAPSGASGALFITLISRQRPRPVPLRNPHSLAAPADRLRCARCECARRLCDGAQRPAATPRSVTAGADYVPIVDRSPQLGMLDAVSTDN
jgi:hypothetical protein